MNCGITKRISLRKRYAGKTAVYRSLNRKGNFVYVSNEDERQRVLPLSWKELRSIVKVSF
jgi:uncharacterized protein YcgL (UPF0745 family)